MSDDNTQTEIETTKPTPTEDPKARRQPRPDVSVELGRLVEMATRYPEIGPPLARLADRLGYRDVTDRVLNMGLEEGGGGIEYHFVAAGLARRENQSEKVLAIVSRALGEMAEWPEEKPIDAPTELLHLVRTGFSTLLFDMEGVDAAPRFTSTVAGVLPTLASHYKKDPFYETLLAQALWFSDRERSEATWEEAVELDDAETTWNARGTWYKEAEKDLQKAEAVYRRGLEAVPHSALLLHNLAQALMERFQGEDADPGKARPRLNEADRLLRRALREAHRPRLRRHIHETVERLKSQRAALPDLPQGTEPEPPGEEEPPPRRVEVNEVVKGRVRSLTTYGAFIDLGRGLSGLLHKTEMSHERIHDPADHLKVGDLVEVKVIEIRPREKGQGVRIGLSRRALVPAPEGRTEESRPPRREKQPRRDGQDRSSRDGGASRSASTGGSMGTLGDLLRAKLKDPET